MMCEVRRTAFLSMPSDGGGVQGGQDFLRASETSSPITPFIDSPNYRRSRNFSEDGVLVVPVPAHVTVSEVLRLARWNRSSIIEWMTAHQQERTSERLGLEFDDFPWVDRC